MRSHNNALQVKTREMGREGERDAFRDEIYAKCPTRIFQVITLISNEAMNIVIIREQSRF